MILLDFFWISAGFLLDPFCEKGYEGIVKRRFLYFFQVISCSVYILFDDFIELLSNELKIAEKIADKSDTPILKFSYCKDTVSLRIFLDQRALLNITKNHL